MPYEKNNEKSKSRNVIIYSMVSTSTMMPGGLISSSFGAIEMHGCTINFFAAPGLPQL